MKFDKKMSFFEHSNAFHSFAFHIKTTDLICTANQVIGFLMKFKTDLKQVKTDFDQINLKIHSAVKRFQLLIDYSESCHICRARRARIPLCCVFTHVCRDRRAHIPLQYHWICPKLIKNKNFLKSKFKCTGV